MSKKESFSKTREHPEIRRSERFYADLTAPMIFIFAQAVVWFMLCGMLNVFFRTRDNSYIIDSICNAALPIYVFSAGLICLIYTVRGARIRKARIDARRFETEIYDMFRTMIDMPYAVVSGTGQVKLVNGALGDILGFKTAMSGMDISEFCTVSIKLLVSSAINKELYIPDNVFDLPEEKDVHMSSVTKLTDGRRYRTVSYVFKTQGENYYFIVFKDIEDYLSLLEKHDAESPAVAYIRIDNLRELTQYVRADYRSASADAENILRQWISDIHGLICEHTKDQYLAVFSRAALEEQIKNDFDVQKRIMELKIGDNSFPITMSMGICASGATLEEKEMNASHALSMAIQRGGNQVAVRRVDSSGYIYFGGTHKTIENNTAVMSRVSGEILEDKMGKASNVLIMGHSNPDFDSLGSCVGMARFAMSTIALAHSDTAPDRRPQVNIVTDKSSETYTIVAERLSHMTAYEDIFIDGATAKDLITPNTVLIICDVNNARIFAAPELAKMIDNIAVIDHHRMANALAFDPFLQYIEVTKSSASEIVSEILSQSKYADTLHKEEAEILLSGIMLDTHNFTRNAGTQTIEATHYLYTRGAHTGTVKEFFSESLDELLLTGEFESKARLYRNEIAITWMTLDKTERGGDRVIAAKVADKLLGVKGVKASFALVKIDNDVIISGRSNGEINVQLILERLKGGGHFDIAGAQIENASLTRTCEMLKSAIDDYYEYDHQE